MNPTHEEILAARTAFSRATMGGRYGPGFSKENTKIIMGLIDAAALKALEAKP